jgi:hypothetical protein
MTPANWAALAVSVMTLLVGFTAAIRFLVKHYLSELKPNGGTSVSDRLNRVERRVDEIYSLLVNRTNS